MSCQQNQSQGLRWGTCGRTVKSRTCTKITTAEGLDPMHRQDQLPGGPAKGTQWDPPCSSALLPLSALWEGKRAKRPTGKIKERRCPSHPTVGFRTEAEQAGGDETFSSGMSFQHSFLHWTDSIVTEIKFFYLKVINVYFWYMWIIRKVMWMKIQGKEEKQLIEDL